MAKKISKASKKVAKKVIRKKTAENKKTASKASSQKSSKVKLLSGGNPQIAKADGDAPIQAYIAAMPGWKSNVGKTIDKVITKTLPNVQKAVKWNSPFYGVEGKGWIINVHCFTKYVKITFFAGGLLKPKPPGISKYEKIRHLNILETDKIDEKQLTDWVKQASKVEGWIP
ncbi:DUF1801 domain-containing protein [Bdellovibrio bacteriovorus]|uniref:DUF1801 domain-containing protein n=1 Tax=Bdellovibrio bacteriovorus TaxID=959 RepID=UPI0035A6C60B